MAKETMPNTASAGDQVRSFFRKQRRTLISLAAILVLALVILGGIFIYYSVINSVSTDGLTFEERSDGTLAVTGYTGTDTTVTVAKKHDGKRVTVIANSAFKDNETVQVLRLRGIEVIEGGAFMGCSALTGVYLPEGLLEIGAAAFAADDALTSVIIPGTVKTIGLGAFVNCTSLGAVKIENGVTDIPERCFANCRTMQELTLPSTLKTIGDRAFEKCRSLTAISIPESVDEIGAYAFSGDSGYKMHAATLKLPSRMTKIGMHAFAYFDTLEKVTLPAGITEIPSYLFYECEKLTRVEVPDGVTSIGEFAFFDDANLYFINIPASVTNIEGLAFYNNPWVNSSIADENGFVIVNEILLAYVGTASEIVLPTEGYHTVACLARGNLALTSVTIPSGSCRALKKQAISNCNNLVSLVIEEGVEELGDSAFYYDVSLTDVTLPASLKKIDKNLFDDCASLTTLTFRGTRTQWKNIEIAEENPELETVKVVCVGE